MVDYRGRLVHVPKVDPLEPFRAIKALDPEQDHVALAELQIEGGRRVAMTMFQRIMKLWEKRAP